MERTKHSDWDFSNYLLEIKKDNLCTIHTLTLRDSGIGRTSFINANDRLFVTGDFKNWVFCRCFVPSAKGYVSPSYWVEKATILSEQECKEFDPEETEKELQEKLELYIFEEYDESPAKFLSDYDFGSDDTIDYLQGCLERVYDHEDYQYFAYRELPNDWDCESVIYCKKIKQQFLIIFDAFNEICKRLEEVEKIKNQSEE